MVQLQQFLFAMFQAFPGKKISILNTDNVNGNGDKIRKYVTGIALDAVDRSDDVKSAFTAWLKENVRFHNRYITQPASLHFILIFSTVS